MKKVVSIILVVVLLMIQVSAVFAEEEYFIQVGAFQSKYNAEKHTKYMIGIGYEAVTIKVFDLYKVFLGPYDSEDRAREILADYKSVGGSGFYITSSQMFYKTTLPQNEVVEETTEETTEEAVEETAEDVVEETTEEVVEETTEETTEEAVEETTEEAVEETTETEGVDVNDDDLEVSIIEQEEPKKENDYKLFTIILIVVLWVLFIISVVIFRLNQNKSKVE